MPEAVADCAKASRCPEVGPDDCRPVVVCQALAVDVSFVYVRDGMMKGEKHSRDEERDMKDRCMKKEMDAEVVWTRR